MTYFCPDCWKIIAASDKRCPFCGCDLAAAEARPYEEKLIGALHHPEPETQLRAAEILGQKRYRPAIGPLLARAREELQQQRPDIYFVATLLRSARDLGAPAQEWQALLAQANSRMLYKLMEKQKNIRQSEGAMASFEINDNHRRALASALHTMQRMLNDFVQLINRARSSVPRRISPEQAEDLRQKIAAVQQQAKDFCERFAIPPPRETDPKWSIQVGVARLWEILEDCKSEPMRGYGEVPETTKTVLDAEVQKLINALQDIVSAIQDKK